MIKSNVVVLPGGYRLDITSDAVATGYYLRKGNPGEADGGLTSIGSNASIQIGPFNEDRQYEIVTKTGSISSAIFFEYVQEGAAALSELTDVTISSPLDQDALIYDDATGKWVNSFVLGGGITSVVEDTSPQLGGDLDLNGFTINDFELDALSDVTIVTPEDGQALVYNAGIWSNEDIFSGDYTDLINTPTLGTMAAETATDYLSKAGNLSGLADTSIARTNLGLGTLATQNGTFSGTSSGTNTGDQDLSGLVPKTYEVIAGTGMTGGGALSGNVTLNCSITQYTNEMAQDTVATLIQNGTGITWSYDDTANTLTPTITITQYTDEMVDDRVSALIQNGTGITWSYNDGANTLTPTVTITQYTDELAQDAVGSISANSTFINLAYDDGTPSLTASLSATGTPDNTKFLRGDNTWASASGGLSDGDYGDVTVSSSGTVITIDTPASATVATDDKILIKDTSASDVMKYVTAQSVANLSGLVYISSATASNSATLEFTGISNTYDAYLFVITALVPATDATTFYMRTSSNNGSSYDSGASDYIYLLSIANNLGSNGAQIHLTGTGTISNVSTEGGITGQILINKPSAASRCLFLWQIGSAGTTADKLSYSPGIGARNTAADVDAVQFLMASGNITSGTIRLYGIKNS